jgi:Fe-S cluster biosynthesis and repair protein YggX
MVGYAMNHSSHAYKVFKHDPGKPGKIIVTRNVRLEHWDHLHKSKLIDSSPLFTKVEVLNKEQKAFLEKAIDTFIINNKMCSTEFNSIAKNNKESPNSDVRRKVDDHQRQVRKSKPSQNGMAKK